LTIRHFLNLIGVRAHVADRDAPEHTAASHFLFKGFPGSLAGVPVLLPGSDSTFRRALDEWFRSHDIRPEISAELDDLALASVLGETGLGVLAAPDVIEKELRQRYGLQLVGRASDIRQRFFAISVERKIKNPAVVAICEIARKKIFA